MVSDMATAQAQPRTLWDTAPTTIADEATRVLVDTLQRLRVALIRYSTFHHGYQCVDCGATPSDDRMTPNASETIQHTAFCIVTRIDAVLSRPAHEEV